MSGIIVLGAGRPPVAVLASPAELIGLVWVDEPAPHMRVFIEAMLVILEKFAI